MKQFLKKIVVSILTFEARVVLNEYRPKIIAITGSVGKTSTKDAIYTVLSKKGYVRKSEKSFNSEVGIPLTVLGLPNAWNNPIGWLWNILRGAYLALRKHRYPETLILEVGADRPGDIEWAGSWIKPDITVITRLGTVPVHVEYFDSPEHVFREKSFLVKALKPNGTLIINRDDEKVMKMKELHRGKVLTYGLNGESIIQAHDTLYEYLAGKKLREPTGFTYKVSYKDNDVPFHIYGTVGKQHLYPTLAAVAVGVAMNVNMVDIAGALKEHSIPNGRMKLLKGINDSVLIDDTYNSSPVALEEALTALNNLETSGRKIAVLGDMLELGKYSTDEHSKAGIQAAQIVDVLITVGVRAMGIADGAELGGLESERIIQYTDATEAGEKIKKNIKNGDVVLVKGSQGMRMEKVVEKIMDDPSQAKSKLVRQDRHWKRI